MKKFLKGGFPRNGELFIEGEVGQELVENIIASEESLADALGRTESPKDFLRSLLHFDSINKLDGGKNDL